MVAVKKIYEKKELLDKTGMDEESMEKLIRGGVLRPAGKVDGANPYFDDHAIETARAAAGLLGMGYSTDDIARINRKVGLPGLPRQKDQPDEQLLTVGELASRTDTNPRTIKHWEEKGIIEPDTHTPGGFRLYREHYVEICRLLMDLQNFGLTLDEIKVIADLVRDFLALRKDPSLLPGERAWEKLAQMKEQIAALRARMDAVESGIKRWRKMIKQKEKELSSLSDTLRKVQKAGKTGPGKGSKPSPDGEPPP